MSLRITNACAHFQIASEGQGEYGQNSFIAFLVEKN